MLTLLILFCCASAIAQPTVSGPSAGVFNNFNSSGYNPASDASVVEWLKADAITGLSDGATIATWQHSTGNDATSAAGSRPVYHTAVKNGLPAAQFSGTEFFTVQTFGTIAQPDAVWIVYRFTALTSTKVLYDGTNSAGRQSAFWSGSSGFIAGFAGSTVATSNAGDTTTWHVLYIKFNGASSQWSIDNSAPATFNPGANSLIGLILGANQPGTPTMVGYIGEVLVQNSAPANVSAVFAYFKGRWNTP